MPKPLADPIPVSILTPALEKRRREGYSYSDIAEAAGYSRRDGSYIQRLLGIVPWNERGHKYWRTEISSGIAAKIARACGYDPVDLDF